MVYFSVTFLCTAGLFLALLEDRYRLWTTVAATVVVYGLALGLAYPIRQLITDPVWGDQVACGAGALLLLLVARVSPLVLSGVEYCPEDAALAHQNLAENGLEGAIYTGDLRAVCKTLPAGGFSLAVSNPPYFKAGSGGCGGPARMEGDCALEDWCAAAGRLLKNGGRFALVHRPERLCDLFAALRSAGLEPKRLRLLQHGPDCPPSAVLLEAVRQGRPGLEILPTLLSNRR